MRTSPFFYFYYTTYKLGLISENQRKFLEVHDITYKGTLFETNKS
jgi:hypothetical protein